jgi:tetratricopeptide (TPR) repeat protein
LLAEVVRRRGVARLRAGAVDGARADAERARELAISANDVARQGDAHQLRAEIEWFTGGDVTPHVEAARAAARAVGDPAREARALHTAACAVADRKEHERGHDAFTRVIGMAEVAGDKAIAAYARGNLGAVLIQQGRLEEAESALEESTAALHAMRDTQSYFVHLYNLAAVRQERGDLERAARGHEEVIRAAAKTKHVSVRGMSLAALGALRAARGEIAEAERLLDEAEAASEPAGQRRVAVVRVHRGHLDLALAREAAKRGDSTAANEHRASAERRLAEGAQWTDTTDDLLTALRWLGRALELESSERYPANAWVIGEDGAWFRQPRGWRIDVGDRQHARAILRALLQARLRSPGRPLATDDVLRAAWPGERLVKRAGTNRVYVTISLLRDLGLRELVLSAEGGYMLDPRHPIAVGAADDADTSAAAARP